MVSEVREVRQLAGFIARTIQQVSGLDNCSALVASYYCLATWFLPRLDPFPILMIIGPNGTGKTQFLRLMGRIACRPKQFTGTRISGPALRDELAEAHEGTAIVDEADDSNDLEAYLSLRYTRSTAVCVVKRPLTDGKAWEQVQIPIFGASIVHKRVPFRDPALDGRSVTIHTVPNLSTRYVKPDDIEPELVGAIVQMAEDIGKSTDLPGGFDIPEGFAQRVVDNYKPLISLALVGNDTEFLDDLWAKLRHDSVNLREGQNYEPGPIVVQALISALMKNGQLLVNKVKIEGTLTRIIQQDFGHALGNRQIAQILRGYGFEVKRIGGPNWVIPNVERLYIVCRSIGLEDDAVNTTAKRMGIVDD